MPTLHLCCSGRVSARCRVHVASVGAQLSFTDCDYGVRGQEQAARQRRPLPRRAPLQSGQLFGTRGSSDGATRRRRSRRASRIRGTNRANDEELREHVASALAQCATHLRAGHHRERPARGAISFRRECLTAAAAATATTTTVARRVRIAASEFFERNL